MKWEEIKWKEPREYLREADRQARARVTPGRRWAYTVGTVVIMLACMVWNRDFDTITTKLDMVDIGVATLWAWCIYWVRPWIRERSSSTVRAGVLGLLRHRKLMDLVSISHHHLSSFYWLHSEHYATLIVLTRKKPLYFNDSFFAFGVPTDGAREKISALLLKKGLIEIAPSNAHLRTPWFRNTMETHGINAIILLILVLMPFIVTVIRA